MKHCLAIHHFAIDGHDAHYGTCDCNQWIDGPRYIEGVTRAYWADHVHLTDESECPLHA